MKSNKEINFVKIEFINIAIPIKKLEILFNE
jgi:hypothetical protein